MKNCPICEKKLIRKDNQSEIIEYKISNGVKNILVEGLSYSECSSCGEIFYNKEDLILHDKQLERALEKERRAKGLLTGKEIKEIRKKLGLTQSDLEELLNLSPKIVVKWETYRSDQSKPIDKILRVMNDDSCIFFALLKESKIKNNEKLIEKHLIKMEYHDTIEFIKKCYPSLKEEQIDINLIKKIDKILKDSINKNLEVNENDQIKFKEAC